MTVALGIDTGGTYTDAALIDQTSGQVLANAKALTTRHDLSIGIGEAVGEALRQAASLPEGRSVSAHDVSLVGLSTTLATNAIVEGHGNSVCLLLVGYSPSLIKQYGFERDLVTPDVVYLEGGHDPEGNQARPLDEAAVREAVLSRRGRADAFAVSGYFGVRNPAHELRVKALIEELTEDWDRPDGLPMSVTCGHELTTRLDSVRRATTAALNARLIPLLRELIATVRHTLDHIGIAAPLMSVKGDGSLVRADWAMRRPIETVLSGPAASVVGAWHLAGKQDVWVIDVGGTTTDIAVLRDGRPRLNPEGAQVGGWRTMVETADVHTVGQGGDSHVRPNGKASVDPISIGPRRVVPLCLLGAEHPRVVHELHQQVAATPFDSLAGQFVLSHRQPGSTLSGDEKDILDQLNGGPRSLVSLSTKIRYGRLGVERVDAMEAQRLVMRSAFTPTDALHVLGRFERWDPQASRLGAELLGARLGVAPEELCQQIVAGVSDRLARELISKVLADEASLPIWDREPSAMELLARAMGDVEASDLECRLTLRRPVVAVGAPVEAYLPRATKHLNTELIIPTHAGVANAVGAVAGGVVQRLQVLIRPVDGPKPYRVHLPDGVHDLGDLEAAVTFASEAVSEQLEERARQAGADQIELRLERTDRSSPVPYGGAQEIYVETVLDFSAVGRPGLQQGLHAKGE